MGRTLWRASPENFPDPCHSGTRYSRHQAHNFFSKMTLSWARRLAMPHRDIFHQPTSPLSMTGAPRSTVP